ncbi:hypothetical protein [Massilia sp. Leaf139]|uniref:hypothetical protein n=1 Tax=Massilia sp. Leaf139 TaxID=1736272 RepID=UPI0012E81CE4|nr:hypothetical protein [Massilia sp. Leaf139]
MSQADMMKYGIAAVALIGAYKFGGKYGAAAAIAIGAVAVAKRVPYVKEVL